MSMGSIKQMSRDRRQKKRSQRHKRSVLLVSAVILALCVVVTINGISLYSKNSQYKAQESELKEKIKDEKARSEEIEAYKDYVNSDEYIADTAKSKLGLAYPDEIIFEPEQ